MEYNELVKALRCDGNNIGQDSGGCTNKKCRYRDPDSACNIVSICEDAATAITDLVVENQSLRNAANGFKARTQRSRGASVSEKPLMGFHVPSDAFDPKNRIELWPSEYKHPKRKKVNQNVEDKKGEKHG